MVDGDIVYEKACGALWLPRLYTPQGDEKCKRNVICPMTREAYRYLKCAEEHDLKWAEDFIHV